MAGYTPELPAALPETKSAAGGEGELQISPLRRNIVFAAMILAIGVVVMDNVAVTQALPTIAAHYAIEPAHSVWLVSIYQLVQVCSLLTLAALADILGFRRVYLGGLLAFALAAIPSTLSPSFELLVAARAVQGVAAAAVLSVNLALIRRIFPDSRLGIALGINATAGALAISCGPMLAGLVIAYASWQWIFAIAVPTIGFVALVSYFALPVLPPRPRRFDLPGAVLTALTFGALLLAVSSMGQGLGAWRVLPELVVGGVAAYLLLRRLRDDPSPILPVDLLRIPAFAFSVVASVGAFCAQMLAFVAMPFQLQMALGFSVVDAGLIFGAWPIAVALTAATSGFLADRLPQGLICGLGMGLLALGMVLLATIESPAGPFDLIWRLGLSGFGFALFQTPNNRILLGSSPRARASAASAALGTTRLLGQALGASLAAMVLRASSGGDASLAFWLAAGFALASASASLLRYR